MHIIMSIACFSNCVFCILRNEQHQYGTGTRNVYGILFDGAWLWEEYVNTLIGDAFYHPKNKTGDGTQHLFCRKSWYDLS